MAWRPAGSHAPGWACRRHWPYCRGLPFPPPYQPFGFGVPEPYAAPPPGPEAPPPPASNVSPAAPSASQTLLPQGMSITVTKELPGKDDGGAEPPPIDRPIQAAERLAACWSPPLPPRGNTVEATIRFSFNSRGAVIGGAPRVAYVKAGAGLSAEEVRESILAAVRKCTPLRFSPSMAKSAPGYPLSIRFIGRRRDENEERK